MASKRERISDSLVASGTLRIKRVASGVRVLEVAVEVGADSLTVVRSCGAFSWLTLDAVDVLVVAALVLASSRRDLGEDFLPDFLG